MSDLDTILDQLVAGDEDKAKETFHNMVVQQSRDEFNKLEPQPEPDAPVQEAVNKSALKAWYDKYSKYEGNNDLNLVLGMIKAWTDTGILTDAYEQNEWSAYLKKTGKDSDTEMDAEEFDAFLTPENAPVHGPGRAGDLPWPGAAGNLPSRRLSSPRLRRASPRGRHRRFAD